MTARSSVPAECTHKAKHVHGHFQTYVSDRCGCPDCTTAWRRYRKFNDMRNRRHERRPGERLTVDGVGVHRRLRALATVGWSERLIAERVGVSHTAVNYWMRRARLSPATAETVKRLYDQLWDKQPPLRTQVERTAVARTKARAQREGWAPPLAWDDDGSIDDPAAKPQGLPHRSLVKATVDEVAVAAALSGRRLRLNHMELDEAIRQATARGWSAAKVAAVLGTTPRTVQRRRAA